MSDPARPAPAWQMSLSAMLSIMSLCAAGASGYALLTSRVTALETTVTNAELAKVPVRLTTIETAAQAATVQSEQNNRALNRIERLLCRSDDRVRQRECERLNEPVGY